jgi:small subunit ribosomal protein S5
MKNMPNTNVNKVRSSDIEFKDRLVSIQRVTKVTKGGRTFSFSAIVVVGNENGVVGYGLGKAKEVTSAIAKGVDNAKKNLYKIPVINGTIPHAQEGKFSGSRVLVKPATPGTGVIAGGAMRAVLESAGVKDILAKSQGSSNPHSVVKATMDALLKLRDPYTVAQMRNIDLDKVFNG